MKSTTSFPAEMSQTNPLTWAVGIPTLLILGLVVFAVRVWAHFCADYDVATEWQNHSGSVMFGGSNG